MGDLESGADDGGLPAPVLIVKRPPGAACQGVSRYLGDHMFNIQYAPGTKNGEKFSKTPINSTPYLLRETADKVIENLTGEPEEYVIVDVQA